MSTEIPSGDLVRRFIFENRPVRGHWVSLEGAWRELRAHKDYPEPVRELLGQAVAASVLLAASLKFSGTLTLQMQGNGAVRLLVAQCTDDFRVRAVARFDEVAVDALENGASPEAIFQHLVGSDGRFAVTIEADEKGTRYQGVVPLTGASLADCLEAYFASSEQLPTRVVLAADADHSVGLLVQKLPDPAHAHESEVREIWEQAQQGAARLTQEDLLASPVEGLLERAFASQDVRLFQGSSVQFECRCNQGRVSNVLRILGADEVRDVLREQGAVTVTCEFCHRPYRFEAGDVEALFSQPPGEIGSSSIH